MGRIEDAHNRSPIHVICIDSLTNSLTNCISYHIHPCKPHLTVLIFAHQFAKMCKFVHKYVISLTNSLTNQGSYHMHSQIPHLTVLKFAHQFATSSWKNCEQLTLMMTHRIYGPISKTDTPFDMAVNTSHQQMLDHAKWLNHLDRLLINSHRTLDITDIQYLHKLIQYLHKILIVT